MSITSRINEMSSHIEQAYDELQGLGADLTNVNKNIENISMVLDDIYDIMPQVSGEGTSLTLDDTRVGKIKSTLKGNTSQSGTPTPTNPIPVNVVSGDNEIVINSKNQLETYNISGTFNGVSYTMQDGVLTLNGTCTSTSGLTGLGIFRQIKGINYKWTFVYESGSCTDYGGGLFMGATPTSMTSAGYGGGFRTNQSRTVGTFNNGEEHTYYLYMSLNNNSTYTNYKIKPLIVQGDEYSYDFEPYQGNTYNIDLPEGIELCKIGNYQDYFYKDSGKWYLHKEIGKVVFNGSETWYKSASYPGNYYCQNGVPNATFHDINCFSNLTNVFWYSIEQLASGDNGIMLEGGSADRTIDFKISSISTLADFKTFLGNTNLILYYTLLTPTNTEITYQPLIDQLNLLEKAMSKEGQTNISQVNNDLPFIISASALKEWQENTSLNSTLSMVNPLSLGNTLNTQEIDNNTQPIEVDNIEPLEEEENEES